MDDKRFITGGNHPAQEIVRFQKISLGARQFPPIAFAFAFRNSSLFSVPGMWLANLRFHGWVKCSNRRFCDALGQDVGYLDNDNTSGFGPENYIVYSGLNLAEDAVLGDYVARASLFYTQTDTAWTLTASVNGVVEWVEEGIFEALSANFGGEETSDPYTVTVDSYGPVPC